MGKSKPRNRAKDRANPAGKPIKPPADPELAAIREKSILPVLKDLQSADANTRSGAARAITNLIETQKTRKLLLREQIVKTLFEQTLTDSSLETRTDGWGILRNLALEEESDFCVHLYRQDILTAIEGVIKTIVQTIESQEPPISKLPKAQQDIVWQLTSSIISLLSSLAEAQDEIIESISGLSTVINFLFGLLGFEFAPEETKNEVLSCLTALTEDNQLLDKELVEKADWLNTLVGIKDVEGVNAVAACGVLHNVFQTMEWFDHNTPTEGASDAMLIPTLVKFIQQPQSNGNATNGHAEYSSPDRVLQLALEITASIATSLQEALEHGNRYEKKFEGFPDEKPEEKDDDEMDADIEDIEDVEVEEEEEDDEILSEMDDDAIDADMALVVGNFSDDEDDEIEQVTLDRLVRLAAPKILILARPTQAEATPIQSHALSALNNIAWTISSIDFSADQLRSLKRFWSKLAQQIWDEIISPVLASNTADIDLAASITSLAWAVARSVKGSIKLQPEEQRKFMALYQASKSLPQPSSPGSNPTPSQDSFQTLGVKSLGVLGTLALPPSTIPQTREISIFLLTTLTSPDCLPADTIEALNQLFDIFADKEYEYDEPVFWGDNLYKHLEGLQISVKKMVKGIDPKKDGELRVRGDEVVVNLGRFLIYKRKERKRAGLSV